MSDEQMSGANWIKGQRLWHVHNGGYRTLCGTTAGCAESDTWPPGDLWLVIVLAAVVVSLLILHRNGVI